LDTTFAALTDRKAADRQLSQLQASLAADGRAQDQFALAQVRLSTAICVSAWLSMLACRRSRQRSLERVHVQLLPMPKQIC
jgi:hypothetical protein